ncbi:MAG: heparinase II/III family protein, partial [Candidatus Hodarchaeota archaeon]
VYSGEYSVHLLDNSSTDLVRLQSEIISVQGNLQANLVIYAYSETSQNMTVRFLEYDQNNNPTSTTRNFELKRNCWNRVRSQYALNNLTLGIRVEIRPTQNRHQTGEIWVDNLFLSLDNSSVNVLPNPDFEYSRNFGSPLAFLWYNPEIAPSAPDNLPTANLFRDLGVGVVRTGWGFEDSILFFKCGSLVGGHDHPDQGTIIYYSRGQHVLNDDEYTYLKSTANHNTIIVNDKEQLGSGDKWASAGGAGYITEWETSPWLTHFEGNVTEAYPDDSDLKSFIREGWFLTTDSRGLLLLSDYVKLNTMGEVRWYFHSDGEFVNVTNSSMSPSMWFVNISDVPYLGVCLGSPMPLEFNIKSRIIVPERINETFNFHLDEIKSGYHTEITTTGIDLRLLTIFFPIHSGDPLSIIRANTEPLVLKLSHGITVEIGSRGSKGTYSSESVQGDYSGYLVVALSDDNIIVSASGFTTVIWGKQHGISSREPIFVVENIQSTNISLVIRSEQSQSIQILLPQRPVEVRLNGVPLFYPQWDRISDKLILTIPRGISRVELDLSEVIRSPPNPLLLSIALVLGGYILAVLTVITKKKRPSW